MRYIFVVCDPEGNPLRAFQLEHRAEMYVQEHRETGEVNSYIDYWQIPLEEETAE
jgi:hypothetical protein